MEYANYLCDGVFRPLCIADKLRHYARSCLINLMSIVSRSQQNCFLRCLYCHYVFDDQVDAFDSLLSALKKNGRFIDTEACMQMIEGKRKIDNKYYHLSFDDGFRNNITNALPVLMKHGIPAIFFVPSALIETSLANSYRYCTQKMNYKSAIEMLTWDDLKNLVSLGYEIGSHTRTHACLSSISYDQKLLEQEIFGSKDELESVLGVNCNYISWPFGRLDHVDRASIQMIKKAKYSACFGAHRGTVMTSSTDIYKIPRHHFEVEWPISHVEFFSRGNMENKKYKLG